MADIDIEELVEKMLAINAELTSLAENVMDLEDCIETGDLTWIYDEDNHLNQARESIGKIGEITGELLTKLDPQDWWKYS